jgi:hypothetical protein
VLFAIGAVIAINSYESSPSQFQFRGREAADNLFEITTMTVTLLVEKGSGNLLSVELA